jgi:hypothetical protein
MNILLCNGLLSAGAQEPEEDTDKKESKLLSDGHVEIIALFH